MKIALLDETGLLIGYDDDARNTSLGIKVEEECDLEPYRYRWDKDMEAFMPCDPPNDMSLEFSAEAALLSLVNEIERKKVMELPAPVKIWRDNFHKTVDSVGVE